jgi:hypothetical protein
MSAIAAIREGNDEERGTAQHVIQVIKYDRTSRAEATRTG